MWRSSNSGTSASSVAEYDSILNPGSEELVINSNSNKDLNTNLLSYKEFILYLNSYSVPKTE